MIENVKTIEQTANTTYKDKETLEFELILDKNYYTNLKNLCFPVRFNKLSKATQGWDPNLLPVNNFFVYWIKEINVIKWH